MLVTLNRLDNLNRVRLAGMDIPQQPYLIKQKSI